MPNCPTCRKTLKTVERGGEEVLVCKNTKCPETRVDAGVDFHEL